MNGRILGRQLGSQRLKKELEMIRYVDIGLFITCEQVSYGITFLQDAGQESSGFNGHILQRCSNTQAPNSPHGNTEQRSDPKELAVCIAERRSNLQNAAEEQIAD